jgi:hypothetical protein
MADSEKLIRSEILCYIQCHLNRTVKSKILECAGRGFSDDDILTARDVLDREYGSQLKSKLKNRRNGQTKMKAEQTLEDIVSAMMELDQNGIHTNFGAKDLIILPKCDPKDVDAYAILERLLAMEEKVRRIENGLNENVSEVMLSKEVLQKAVDTIKTHETLLTEKIDPTQPTFANVLSRPGGYGGGRLRSGPGSNSGKHNQATKYDGANQPRAEVVITGGVTTNQSMITGGTLSDDAPARKGSRHSSWIKIGRDGKPESVSQSQPQLNKRRVIQGNAQSDTIRGAPPPRRDFFVSRVHKETDDEGFKMYITGKGVKDLDLTLVSNPNATFKSYKLSVGISDKDKVLCSEMWPAGICIQRWRVRSSGAANSDVSLGATIPQHG